MIERLKVLRHALVLACQEANVTNTTLAVVKLTHHHYGEYYKGIDYDKAKAEKYKILRKFKPGDSMAV
jgi:hypothetical protein